MTALAAGAYKDRLDLLPMESLLRLDDNLDVALLDKVVATFYTGHGPEVLNSASNLQ